MGEWARFSGGVLEVEAWVSACADQRRAPGSDNSCLPPPLPSAADQEHVEPVVPQEPARKEGARRHHRQQRRRRRALRLAAGHSRRHRRLAVEEAQRAQLSRERRGREIKLHSSQGTSPQLPRLAAPTRRRLLAAPPAAVALQPESGDQARAECGGSPRQFGTERLASPRLVDGRTPILVSALPPALRSVCAPGAAPSRNVGEVQLEGRAVRPQLEDQQPRARLHCAVQLAGHVGGGRAVARSTACRPDQGHRHVLHCQM
eukprot:scaffold1220_cov117-Isochrysis_galbana.AAC.10